MNIPKRCHKCFIVSFPAAYKAQLACRHPKDLVPQHILRAVDSSENILPRTNAYSILAATQDSFSYNYCPHRPKTSLHGRCDKKKVTSALTIPSIYKKIFCAI